MPISRGEAAQTLKDIESTQGRSASAYGYSMASPHLILWGAIWVIGYGVPWLAPGRAGWIWLPLVVAGVVSSGVIGVLTKPKGVRDGMRFWATFAAIFAFVAAQFATMPQLSLAQSVVYSPLVVALMYALMGIWMRGQRMTLLGAAIGALALIGYFLLPQLILPWMAVIGGGGLILGGLWLRKA